MIFIDYFAGMISVIKDGHEIRLTDSEAKEVIKKLGDQITNIEETDQWMKSHS